MKKGSVDSLDDDRFSSRNSLAELFADFGLNAEITDEIHAPQVYQYEVKLGRGVLPRKLTQIKEAVAAHLRVSYCRINGPLPGKGTFVIEVPRLERHMVLYKKAKKDFIPKGHLPVVLGKTLENEILSFDLTKLPHLLVAGCTGSGKSVMLHVIIKSILDHAPGPFCGFMLCDPKKVEFVKYATNEFVNNPPLGHYTEIPEIIRKLKWLCEDQMDMRYKMMQEAGVKNIEEYNNKIEQKMGYIVCVIDELSDLMQASKEQRKEVEGYIIRIAQLARAAGIHLVVATQNPIATVVTSLIKSNIPAKVCFQVTERRYSRVVLDQNGAEELLGFGDGLFKDPNNTKLIRFQGALIE